MSEQVQHFPVAGGEFTVEVLFSRVWHRKWLVVLLALICSTIAGIAALVLPKTYMATLVAAPALNNNSAGALGGLGSMASQFGGLASLAGISVPGDSRKYEAIAVLQSEALTEKYISSHDLLPILYADEWDSSQKTWKKSDTAKNPTLWKANRYFKRIRSVSIDAKTGLITMSIKWTNPKLAAAWANDLVALTNEYLRNKAIAESELNLAYLNAEVMKTDIVPVKQGIYTMIQGEINKVMVAKGTSEFSLKVLDPAVAPERASSPQISIWISAGFFLGTLVACCIALYLESRSPAFVS